MVSLKLTINPGPEKLSYQTLHRKLGPVEKVARDAQSGILRNL